MAQSNSRNVPLRAQPKESQDYFYTDLGTSAFFTTTRNHFFQTTSKSELWLFAYKQLNPSLHSARISGRVERKTKSTYYEYIELIQFVRFWTKETLKHPRSLIFCAFSYLFCPNK